MTYMEVMVKRNWILDALVESWALLRNELELVGSSEAGHNRSSFALLRKCFVALLVRDCFCFGDGYGEMIAGYGR